MPQGAEPKEKPDKPEKSDEEKLKGPDHNVTLSEEQGVVELLKKAQKARARAETDPSAWPECVKLYADILKKYPSSVYLDKWEGPEKAADAKKNPPDNPDYDPFKNGLYKSTRERVANDIATLPAGGLEIYRTINDPPARALFQDAQERIDERKMEQVAVDYSSTSVGLPAIAWLAEYSCDSGARRQAISRVDRVLKDPTAKAQTSGLLVRKLLGYLSLGEQANAERTLKELAGRQPEPR